MLGAIAGDVIGSIYERQRTKAKDFPLFSPRCTGRACLSLIEKYQRVRIKFRGNRCKSLTRNRKNS